MLQFTSQLKLIFITWKTFHAQLILTLFKCYPHSKIIFEPVSKARLYLARKVITLFKLNSLLHLCSRSFHWGFAGVRSSAAVNQHSYTEDLATIQFDYPQIKGHTQGV